MVFGGGASWWMARGVPSDVDGRRRRGGKEDFLNDCECGIYAKHGKPHILFSLTFTGNKSRGLEARRMVM